MEWETNQGYLQFDNLNFKLAVIQHLAFELEILKVNHGLGDFDDYRETFEDYNAALRSYYENALTYYERLQIPAYMASYIDTLFIRIDDDIYLDIYPDWCGEGGFFKITDISEREAKQFPSLKEITFIDTTSQGSIIKKKLKPLGITVDYSKCKETKHERQVPLIIAILVLLAGVTIVSALFVHLHAGYLFQAGDHAAMEVEGEVTEGESSTLSMADAESEGGTESETDADAEKDSGLQQEKEYVLNDKYSFVNKEDGRLLLLDKEVQAYIDLGQYQYAHVIFLYKDDTLLDDRGLLVSEDGAQWSLIMDDYSNPVLVDTEGYDEISYSGMVNISSDTPYYFDLVAGMRIKE